MKRAVIAITLLVFPTIALAEIGSMREFEFVSPNNPVLDQLASPVSDSELKTREFQSFVTDLLRFASGKQKSQQRTLVRVAAPQIGISKRVIVVDVGADGKGKLSNLNVYINPVIKWKSEEMNEWYEGCFSTGNVTGIVNRSSHVRVQYLTKDGRSATEEFHGYVARIFQHEVDHLNGVEFVNHVSDSKKLHWVEPSEFAAYRNKEAWRHWEKLCPWEQWLKIKSPPPR